MTRRAVQIVVTVTLFAANSLVWADGAQTSKSADRLPSDVAWHWFERLYDVVKAERTSPPVASRIYGLTAVALYESVVSGTRHHRSLSGQLNSFVWVPQPRPNAEYAWPVVANAAIATTIRGLYPAMSQTSLDSIAELEERFTVEQQALISTRVYNRSVSYGERVAEAILDWAASDGFAVFANCPYSPALLPGAWKPTPPAFNPNPLQPCWGLIRPMVLTAATECSPSGHPPFSTSASSDFYAAALEVYDVGRNLTNEQKAIANYWSDGVGDTGTPPGHWIAIVSQIARNDRLSLATAAEAYARAGIAVHDAFIGCWGTKYFYQLQRPVTYIIDTIDPAWTTYLITPAFPSYTSGHSTQSGAAARTLTDMFGRKRFRDTTHLDHGLVPPQAPRAFRSFNEAAAEAAVSRLYGGIHYKFDNDDGLVSGWCIAQAIHDRIRFKDRRADDEPGGRGERGNLR